MRSKSELTQTRATGDFIAASTALAQMGEVREVPFESLVAVSSDARRFLAFVSRWASSGSVLAGPSPLYGWLRASRASRASLAMLTVDDVEREVADAMRMLEDEPIEAGVVHAAEDVLRGLAQMAPTQLSAVLGRRIREAEPDVVAGALQCLGRLGKLTLPWGIELARVALTDSSPRVRGGAIKAIELWETPEAFSLLVQHEDPVPVLAAHARRLCQR